MTIDYDDLRDKLEGLKLDIEQQSDKPQEIRLALQYCEEWFNAEEQLFEEEG